MHVDNHNEEIEEPEENDNCGACGVRLERKGEDWDQLCPGCADSVSNLLDELSLTDEDADVIIEFARKFVD